MEFASPIVQLLGVVSSILVCTLCLVASCFLLKEKHAGPWMMLVGSAAALIGTGVPQSLYALENFVASHSGAIFDETAYTSVRTMMYYSVWDWLATAAWLVFAAGLMLVALRRRGQARRLAELERILAARDSIHS